VDHGCSQLGFINLDFVGDFELMERSLAFAGLCREAYLDALKVSKDKN
jgi:hypothetical protein